MCVYLFDLMCHPPCHRHPYWLICLMVACHHVLSGFATVCVVSVGVCGSVLTLVGGGLLAWPYGG